MALTEAQPIPATSTYDVVVVGARPAGAAVAMLLARQSLRVVLLDQQPAGRDALSTHALMRGGVLQLRRWGLLDEIAAAGTPAVRRTTFRYGGDRIVVTIKPSHGVDALYAPRRTVLDPILVHAAADAGAVVHHHLPVTGLTIEGGRVAGVTATEPGGRVVEFRAALVIGADGAQSTVARLTGARLLKVGEHASAMTYAYWPHFGETSGYEWIYRPNACAGVIPTNGGETCVFAAASPARIRTGGAHTIRAILAATAPDIAEQLSGVPARGPRTFNGRPGYVRSANGPGWALVGDAASFIDPIAAHGLTAALRDAELLARAVGSSVSDASRLDSALADYALAHRYVSVPLLDIVDRVASHQWDDVEIAQLLARFNSVTADEIEMLAAFGPEYVP
jgi:2-polyprenyl-6-methoxyphenol hydroxylase-like FAD-dependent oxidoreductase